MRWRLIVFAFLLLFAAGFLLLHFGGWLDFGQIKAHHGQLQGWVAARPLLAHIGFFVFFVVATALSIPVATVLTLLAGSVFGFWQALLLVSFASSAGATLAMLLSRYFLREQVEKRWPRWVAPINRGLEDGGILYLLALRLAPTPPFFVVNLLLGLTRVPAWRFFIVSQIGMLPLDVVFVNAGHALASINAPEDVLDAGTLTVLAVAALLPLLLRWLMKSRMKVPDPAPD
ncbi:MAG: TVP38/TMEM64 family protein [Moraxellaceae bacterium]